MAQGFGSKGVSPQLGPMTDYAWQQQGSETALGWRSWNFWDNEAGGSVPAFSDLNTADGSNTYVAQQWYLPAFSRMRGWDRDGAASTALKTLIGNSSDANISNPWLNMPWLFKWKDFSSCHVYSYPACGSGGSGPANANHAREGRFTTGDAGAFFWQGQSSQMRPADNTNHSHAVQTNSLGYLWLTEGIYPWMGPKKDDDVNDFWLPAAFRENRYYLYPWSHSYVYK